MPRSWGVSSLIFESAMRTVSRSPSATGALLTDSVYPLESNSALIPPACAAFRSLTSSPARSLSICVMACPSALGSLPPGNGMPSTSSVTTAWGPLGSSRRVSARRERASVIRSLARIRPASTSRALAFRFTSTPLVGPRMLTGSCSSSPCPGSSFLPKPNTTAALLFVIGPVLLTWDEEGERSNFDDLHVPLKNSIRSQRRHEFLLLRPAERSHGKPHFARIAPQDLERAFDGNGIGRQAQEIAAERKELLVPLLRPGQVSLVEGREHRFDVAGNDVPHHRNDAAPTDRQKRQGQAVVPRENCQIAQGRDLRRLVHRARRFLDRHDIRQFGDAGDRLGFDILRRAAGNVIENNRQIDLGGDRAVMLKEPFLRGLVVIGGDHQGGVGAGLLRELREADRLARAVRPGARH